MVHGGFQKVCAVLMSLNDMTGSASDVDESSS
jgi:hypothetical protein